MTGTSTTPPLFSDSNYETLSSIHSISCLLASWPAWMEWNGPLAVSFDAQSSSSSSSSVPACFSNNQRLERTSKTERSLAHPPTLTTDPIREFLIPVRIQFAHLRPPHAPHELNSHSQYWTNKNKRQLILHVRIYAAATVTKGPKGETP